MNKKKILICSTFIVILFSSIIVIKHSNTVKGESSVQTENIVAYVNEIPVEKEEIHLIMQLSGRSVTEGTNKQEFNDPKAIERILEIKTAQQAAKQMGVVQDISFSHFLKELDIENKRRADAIKQKEVLYGPKQYSNLTYYDYRYSVMMNNLKSAWSKQDLDMSEQKLVDYFNQNREVLAKKHDTIRIYKISQPKKDSEQAKQKLNEIKNKLNGKATFLNLYRQLESKQGLTGTDTIQESNYREISKYRSEYYQLVNELPIGQISEVIEDQESYSIVLVTQREPGAIRPLPMSERR
ncbi:peptidyl-prolyl cis-trans isomerase [Paenibacillus pini]|nr:peptidylprolyl isomerase [Paenibacillus pini]